MGKDRSKSVSIIKLYTRKHIRDFFAWVNHLTLSIVCIFDLRREAFSQTPVLQY